EAAGKVVYEVLDPTPALEWPLLSERAGCELLVKHESHLPTGAFKVRGGLVYTASLAGDRGVVCATCGNHGQCVAFAARRAGLAATIVVPHGNSREKNAAMRAYGARLVEHGRDFDEALERAHAIAGDEDVELFPSVHPLLVRGVATGYRELLLAAPDLDVLYVPIGLGSGILAAISAREALGRNVEIVGVVSANADAYARSHEAGRPVPTDRADTLADGLAVRVPHPEVVDLLARHVARVVRVGEDAIRGAMRDLFSGAHQVAEGAGAAAFAAACAERERLRGRRAAVVVTGGNVDREAFARILAGDG
ncbi:MAG: threonine dehydratase, partial [Myxococcota bacterium]